MKSRFDLVKLGFALGVITPVIAFFIFYFIKSANYANFREYIDFLIVMGALPKLLSLMVIPNLLIFFIFIWTEHMYAARGVLAATIFDALAILALKIIF
jgi:hypothetical protein